MSLEKQVEALVKEIKLDREQRSKMDYAVPSRDSRSSDVKGSNRDPYRYRNKVSEEMFTTSLTDYTEEMVRLYGGTINYMNEEFENTVSMTAKLQGQFITDMANDATRVIGGRSIVNVFGSAEAVRNELEAIYGENSYYLNRIAEDYQDADDAGTEMMANALITQRAMRINNRDFQSIIANEMAGTKKVTLDVFSEIAFYAEAYSNRTAASVFQITNNISAALADFDRFGAASTESIGKLGGMLGQLKLDTGSVTGLVDKMQTFEGAATIARDLGGAFQAVLDPLELMELSFTDPAAALNLVRQSMIDAGADTESLGHAITLFAKNMNMSTDAARRFLDGQIDANEVLKASGDDMEYSAAKAGEAVENAQRSIIDTRSELDIVLESLEASTESLFNKPFIALRDLRQQFKTFIGENASFINEMLPDEQSVKDFQDVITEYYTASDDAAREASKDKLNKYLDDMKTNASENLQAKINDMQKELNEISDKDHAEFIKTLQESQDVTYNVNFDAKDVESTYAELNKSEEIKKYHTLFDKPYLYVKRQSPSQFTKDMISNFESLSNSSIIKNSINYLETSLNSAARKRELKFELTPESKKSIQMLEKIEKNLTIKSDNSDVISAINRLNTSIKELKDRPVEVENNVAITGDVKMNDAAIASLNNMIATVVSTELKRRGLGK
mgnify:CR=1 FL=1